MTTQVKGVSAGWAASYPSWLGTDTELRGGQRVDLIDHGSLPARRDHAAECSISGHKGRLSSPPRGEGAGEWEWSVHVLVELVCP